MIGQPVLYVFSWQVQVAARTSRGPCVGILGPKKLLVHRQTFTPNRNQLKKNNNNNNPASLLYSWKDIFIDRHFSHFYI